jgi:ubiquitin-conjugating enzyme E2 Q
MKEFNRIKMTQLNDPVFTVDLVNDNMFEWSVRLHKIDPDSRLAMDMRELEIPYILLRMVFPKEFPFAPPFVRVITPRIERGFVMHGGAICLELLTPAGWCCAYSVESVIMQIASNLVKGQVSVTLIRISNSRDDNAISEAPLYQLLALDRFSIKIQFFIPLLMIEEGQK